MAPLTTRTRVAHDTKSDSNSDRFQMNILNQNTWNVNCTDFSLSNHNSFCGYTPKTRSISLGVTTTVTCVSSCKVSI